MRKSFEIKTGKRLHWELFERALRDNGCKRGTKAQGYLWLGLHLNVGAMDDRFAVWLSGYRTPGWVGTTALLASYGPGMSIQKFGRRLAAEGIKRRRIGAGIQWCINERKT